MAPVAGATSITSFPSCCRNAADLTLLVQTETFEEGRLISSYVDKPTNKYSITLANIGLSGYLQMLLKDNFVHADLHPGNILVRLVDPNTLWGRIATFLKVGHAGGQHVDRQRGLLLRHSQSCSSCWRTAESGICAVPPLGRLPLLSAISAQHLLGADRAWW